MKLECAQLKCKFEDPKIIIAVIECIQRGCATTENTWIYTNVQICAQIVKLQQKSHLVQAIKTEMCTYTSQFMYSTD